jgi:DinB family protein
MNQQKLSFLTSCTSLLQTLPAEANGKWGKMNAQQMVEHVAAFFYVSGDKIKFELVTPIEHLPKYKEFLRSEKEFRENTKAPLTVLAEEPMPLRYNNINEAITDLKKSIDEFVAYFKNDPNKTTLHPVFGELNFEEWILLHYKHVQHHFKQFGLI